MTTPAEWQKANEAYLVAALVWLRLRLEKLAGPPPPTGAFQLMALEIRVLPSAGPGGVSR